MAKINIPNKREILDRDIKRLMRSIDFFENKLTELDNDPRCDPSLVSKYIKEKTESENLLDLKIKEFQKEEYAEQNKVPDEEMRRLKENFTNKNNTYTFVRGSYVKSDDN